MTNLDSIKSEAKRIEEDSLYSSKGHFYAASRWGFVHFCLGISSTVLAAIAGTSALSTFDYHNIVAGTLSILVACLSGIITFTHPDKRTATHLSAGNDYNALRNEARIFHDIELDQMEPVHATSRIKELDSMRNSLNKKSLQIPKWAFQKARKGIESGEADYKADNN